jgi:Ca2+-binding RTX toxin-like protein
VTVNATTGNDVVIVSDSVSVSGLSAQIGIEGGEPEDQLIVYGLAGDDVIDASTLPSGTLGLILDGGDGNDVLLGGAGNDTLRDGAGDDILEGGAGNNVLLQD